jgi:DGQHR domain-containing protein
MTQLRIPAIEFIQNNNRLFIFTMTAVALAKIVRSRPNLSTDKEGVQRLLNQKRLEEIAKYVSDKKFTPIPNSIVINFNNQVKFESTGKDGFGYLIFPSDDGHYGDILDGQHRLYGTINENSKMPELPLAVTGVMLNDPKLAGKVFADINRLQVKASPVLIVSIRLEIGDLPNEEESASAIVQRLNEDTDSPLYRKIQMHQDEKDCWITNDKAINIIIEMLKPRNELARTLKHIGTERSIALIKDYLRAVSKLFVTAWGNNRNYRLTKPAGLTIILKLFDRVFQDGLHLRSATGNYPDESDFFELLQPISNAVWDANTFKQEGFTSAGGILRYVDDLLMKFPVRGA